MVTEHIFDFEWRPLQNYLRDRDIAIPPFAAEQESRSDALYNWIVSKGYSGKEGLNLGTYYHISDYGVIGLALLCAENVGDILKVIRAYVKLFNRDIANVGVKPRENYEVEIHISVNFKPEWNDASSLRHLLFFGHRFRPAHRHATHTHGGKKCSRARTSWPTWAGGCRRSARTKHPCERCRGTRRQRRRVINYQCRARGRDSSRKLNRKGCEFHLGHI